MSEPAILLVDDEEALRETFVIFLRRAGYRQVVEAADLTEALAQLRARRFDLVISDIVLGADSGVDLLREARRLGIQCPVVMITGYPSVETAAEAVRLGAFDYLTKPVSKDALLAVVARGLEEEERRQAETARLCAGETALSRLVLDALPEMVFAVDARGTVTAMNDLARSWCQRFLPSLGRGKPLAPEHPLQKAMLLDCQQVLATGRPKAEHRLEWRDEQGVRVVGLAAAPCEGGVVLTLRDATGSASQRREIAPPAGMVGESEVMQRLFRRILQVAEVDATVLLTGESGTGKNVVARAIHAASARKEAPFVQVDCASLPEEILESELFGHRRGAFTGAERDRRGRILQADGGTLFLDELGEISAKMQLRLLRFLQSRFFYPVGCDKPVSVDVRVIAATNADLAAKVRAGEFREDLYYRLRVVDIHLPALRHHREDIPLLARHFLARAAAGGSAAAPPGISEQAMRLLMRYRWPGNVRELAHVMERALVFCQGEEVLPEHLPPEVGGDSAVGDAGLPAGDPPPSGAAREAGEGDEAMRLLAALRRTGGNKAKAARLLGIDRSTLYRKLRFHGIDPTAYLDGI